MEDFLTNLFCSNLLVNRLSDYGVISLSCHLLGDSRLYHGYFWFLAAMRVCKRVWIQTVDLYVVIISSTSNLAIHSVRNILSLVYAVISGIGNASYHQENLLINVNR